MGRSINQIDEFCLICVLIYFGHFINFFAFNIFYPLFDFNYLCLLIKTIIFDMHKLLPILLFVIKTILVKAFSLIVLILSSGAFDEFLAILHVLGPKILIILLCVLRATVAKCGKIHKLFFEISEGMVQKNRF